MNDEIITFVNGDLQLDYPLEVGKYYRKTNSYFLESVGVNTAEIVEGDIKKPVTLKSPSSYKDGVLF